VDVGEDADAHGSRATLARLAVGAALVAVWVGTALVLLRTEVPDDLALPSLDPRDYFGPDFLERADHVRAVTRALFLGSTVVELAVGVLVVWQAPQIARRLRLRGRYRTGLALGLVTLAAVWIATLPFGVVGHWWARRYGLSHQAYPAWLWDSLVSLAVRAVLVSLAIAGVLWLAGRFGGRWWIAASPAIAALAVVVILVQPLVIQPLFNRFEPLRDPALAAEVERVAAREGVTVDRVEVADASRRTTTANAYVAGIGPTKRVVFYDTALDGRFTEAELVSLAAHELGHVARNHLWKGIAWFVLFAVPGLALVAFVTERRGGLRDPLNVPLALLVGFVFFLATLPLQNAVSRRYEAEADWLALTATRDPDAAIGLERGFVVTSIADPDPPAWVRLWLGTHPTAMRRIAMGTAFESRQSDGRRRR
jgi:Zn-dependent protease with chaperone function